MADALKVSPVNWFFFPRISRKVWLGESQLERYGEGFAFLWREREGGQGDPKVKVLPLLAKVRILFTFLVSVFVSMVKAPKSKVDRAGLP